MTDAPTTPIVSDEDLSAIRSHLDRLNITSTSASVAAMTWSWSEECEAEVEEWLVPGMIPKRSYVLLYGRRGAAKSFVALDIAQRAAAGAPVFGRDVERFGTVYFVGEKKSRFGKRVKAWEVHHGRTRQPVVIVWGCPNLLDPASVAEAIKLIHTIRPLMAERGVKLELIVFDTLIRALKGANDSDFEVAGKATEAIQRIIDECAVSVMPTHHMAKAADANTARGAGVWEDAADSIIRIERKEGEKLRKLQLTKQSDEADGLEWGFELQVVEVGTSPRGKPITSCVIRPVDLGDVPTARKSVRLSPAGQKLMQAFGRLLGDGHACQAPLHIPGVKMGMQAVTLNQFREKSYEVGLSAGATPPDASDEGATRQFQNTRAKAFRDGLAKLELEGLLRQEAGFVWDPNQRVVA